MANKSEAYLTLSAILRAREPKMLNAEKASRMLDAATFEEAAKSLTDCGYEDMSQYSAAEIDKALEQRRSEIYYDLDRLTPDTSITDLFRMKYDYHNAKVLIKAEGIGVNGDKLLSAAGRIEIEKLKKAYQEEDFLGLPEILGKAVVEAKSVLARTSNPQKADFILDRAYFEEYSACAALSKNEFLKGYAGLMIDAANLKSAVRTMKLGKGSELLDEVLVNGGTVDMSRIIAADNKEELTAVFDHTELSDAAALLGAVVDGGPMTEFELACDNSVNRYLQQAKMVSYGSEPVVAYLAALEGEMTAVRMILTGRLAGVEPQTIRERLRDLYA